MSHQAARALAVLIFFAVFIAYEIAGGSPLFPDLHTVSWYAKYKYPLLKYILLFIPPAIYQAWWLWHVAQRIPK